MQIDTAQLKKHCENENIYTIQFFALRIQHNFFYRISNEIEVK